MLHRLCRGDRGLPVSRRAFSGDHVLHVLEHVPDPVAVVTHAAKLLESGGRMVTVTPNFSSLGHKVFGRDWFALDPPQASLSVFTNGLARLFRATGIVSPRGRFHLRANHPARGSGALALYGQPAGSWAVMRNGPKLKLQTSLLRAIANAGNGTFKVGRRDRMCSDQEIERDVMAQNLVSIIVPCYRGSRFLAEAIESCLRQTHRELEVIVVDDASPDDCAEIAERYARSDSRVRVIRRPENGGVSRAFNSGLEAARGEYLTRLAQDDVFGESAIEVMLRQLQDHPDAGLVYCDGHVIDERGAVKQRFCLPEPTRCCPSAIAWASASCGGGPSGRRWEDSIPGSTRRKTLNIGYGSPRRFP